MTYIPADPLLDARSLQAARRGWVARPAGPSTTLFFESGRTALWAALRALGLGPGDRLVVPAYICDSILPAPRALGIAVRYIPVDRRLQPDLAALERELAGGARAVLAVHYFGFPAPALDEVLALCARAGAALIEDGAHGLYSRRGGRPLGEFGAAAVFSPWKSLPLPDGGLLQLNGRPCPADLGALPRPPRALTARRLAYRLVSVVETALGHSPRLWLLRSWRLRRTLQQRTALAALVPRRGSRLAEAILRGTSECWVVERRRANYSCLLAAVRDAGWATPLYEELPEGVCPLGLPVLATDRERARRRLLAAGVNVRAYWEQLPETVSVEAFADAHHVANRILVLPVHQSLTPAQIATLRRVILGLEAS